MAAPVLLRRPTVALLLGSSLLWGTGCSRVRHYAHEAVRTLTDPIFSHYDDDRPDTRFNRKRFERHLGLPCPPDVRQLYCFADELGIDSKYQFSFRCSPATLRQLVARDSLRPEAIRTAPFGLIQPFPWWPKGAEQGLPVYWRTHQERWFQYLWYDTSQQRAYYLEFDM